MGCESVGKLPITFPKSEADLPHPTHVVSVPVERERMTIRERLTVYDEAADGWKLVPGKYVMRVGDRRRICRWSRR